MILVGKLKPPIAHTSGIKDVNIEYGIVIILIKNIKVLITPIIELIIVVFEAHVIFSPSNTE